MEAVRHSEVLCFGKTDRDMIETYVEGALKNNE
jgi:hypothetical protein